MNALRSALTEATLEIECTSVLLIINKRFSGNLGKINGQNM